MEEAIHQQWEQEGADVLSIGQPQTCAWIAWGAIQRFEGEDVDEDGTRAVEEDVEWGGVLEHPSGGEGLVAEVEGDRGGGEPLRGGPLPGIGGDGNSGMAEDELRAGVVYFRYDEVAALLHGPAEGRGKKVEHLRARRRGDGTDGQLSLAS